MSAQHAFVFKFATEDWEFEQIHRLNYKTFVEEIPQHQRSASDRLVDKFHTENTYLICLSGQKLAGMLAARSNRPFSLGGKLSHLDSYLPAGYKLFEVRLLSIEKQFRGTQILQGLLALLWQHAVENSYDVAVISGTTKQFRLYQHIGFIPFGPMVGSGEAQFQPMYVTIETFESTARKFLRSSPSNSFQPNTINFLPGPVAVSHEVRRAFEQVPESHRANSFMKDFHTVKQLLTKLVHAQNVELFLGSGTLANDVIGAQLSLEPRPGVVVSNGEFGHRLIDQTRRFQLVFETIKFAWGQPLDFAVIRKALEKSPAPGWLWCVHCETSTSVLNDIEKLKVLCAEFQIKLCLDCISSIGTMPVDLSNVFLASCSSGKGLRSYPGISMVFHHHDIPPQPEHLPRYLDLGYYTQQQGVPFTFSSNLLHALHAAVKHVDWEKRFADTVKLSAFLREQLITLGFNLIGSETTTSPVIFTIALPTEMNSVKTAKLLQDAGYLISHNSEYLRKKN
jgi:aspartate aminotransferase-like enzyme